MLFSLISFSKAISIVKNKKVNSVIVVNDNKTELLAATELSYFFKRATRCNIPVISEHEYHTNFKNKSAIIVGSLHSNGLVKKYIHPDFFDSLTHESVLLKTVSLKNKSLLFVSGTSSKGVLNSAYTLIEEIIKQLTQTTYPDIDYALHNSMDNLSIKDMDISLTPYCSVKGLELEGMGLSNTSLLDMDKRRFVYKKWCSLVDWAKRHRMNFISNWPYSGESSMNNFPDIVILDNYKKISKFSETEIKEAAAYRKEFFKYANDNGVNPYIMIYVPGWINAYTAQSYPDFAGNNFQEFVKKSGGRPYNWGNADVHRFMADLVSQVVKTYPEIKGIHLRVWGAESAPDAENKNRSAELIRMMIKKMVNAACEVRPDIRFILSGYSNFQDNDFAYAHTLPGNITLQMKWDEDWAVSNDPAIPKEWLAVNDHISRAVSLSIPNEEAIPLWFPSVKLYQEGMQKYLKPEETTIDGFPVNFREWDVGLCDNDLNLSAIAKMSWEPFSFNYKKFYSDNYRLLFGEEAVPEILESSGITAKVMAVFLTDYAGIIEGMWPGNYFCLKSLIGKGDDDKWYKAIRHITSKADRPEYLQQCKLKLTGLIKQQKQAVDLLNKAREKVKRNSEIFYNMCYVNNSWYYILQSRFDAINVVLCKDEKSQNEFLNDFLSNDEKLKYYVRQLTNFSQKAVGDYHQEIRKDLLDRITAEQEYMVENYGSMN